MPGTLGGALLSSAVRCVMSMQKRSSDFLILGLLLAGCDLTDRSTKPEVACYHNLRQIDWAEEQWALEKHKTPNDTPTRIDLQGYLRSTNITCPVGGTYRLTPIGEPLTCSVPGQAALYRKNRPQTVSPAR